jgi:hypothetical protein
MRIFVKNDIFGNMARNGPQPKVLLAAGGSRATV